MMRHTMHHATRSLAVAAAFSLAMATNGALAQSSTPNPAADTTASTFGTRTENPDGSVALTVGRRLSTEWQATEFDAKVGTDVTLAAPRGSSASENFLRGATTDQSSGVLWAKVTMPGFLPSIWDKTSIEARVDPGQDQGKLGATLSRSMPVGRDLSISLQNTYAVAHSLPDRVTETPAVPVMANPLPSTALDGSASWTAGQSVQLNFAPSRTALSVGGALSSTDAQWHNKLSLEQSLFGPLKITTSIEDAGTAASRKSITAAFKRAW
jgi:hypothetical protein